jgi:hypothetical protein
MLLEFVLHHHPMIPTSVFCFLGQSEPRRPV